MDRVSYAERSAPARIDRDLYRRLNNPRFGKCIDMPRSPEGSFSTYLLRHTMEHDSNRRDME